MIPTGHDSLNTRSTLEAGGKRYAYYSLPKASAALGDVDHGRNAGKILHQHARRTILDLAVDLPLLEPVGHRLEVVAGDRHAILEAQQIDRKSVV